MLVPLTCTRVMTSVSRAMVPVLVRIITHTYVGMDQTDIGSRAKNPVIEFMLNELGPINTRNCISDLLNRQTEGPTTVEGSWEITLDGDLNLSYYTLFRETDMEITIHRGSDMIIYPLGLIDQPEAPGRPEVRIETENLQQNKPHYKQKRERH